MGTHEEEMKKRRQADKKDKNEKIEKLREANCSLCGKPQFIVQTLAVYKSNEAGEYVPFEEQREDGTGIAVGVPMCQYHFFLAQTGLITVVSDDGTLDKLKPMAPWDAIRVCEAVFDAKMQFLEFEKSPKKATTEPLAEQPKDG